MGDADKKLDRDGPEPGVRMYSKEDVELALEGLAEGMSFREVCEMVGCRESTAHEWAAGRLPRSCTGAPLPPRRCRMAPLPGEGGEGAVTDGERAAYEAAMTENQLLRAVLDDLKEEGCAPRSISNRRKAECGERLRRETGLPLREITSFLRISKSSYEYQRARLGEDRDAALRGPVREAFEEGRGCYGYRRVNALLRLRGTRVSEKRVRRVMRDEGLVAAGPRRRRYSSYAGEPDGRPANVPRERAAGAGAGHDFSAGAPGELAVTDVSEIPAAGRKYYLSPVVDCYDGLPASWALSPHPDSALCDGSLEAYLDSLPEGSSPVVHTDGGGPYRAASWKGICSRRGVTRSMSRPGRCGDNARAEGFFGTLKVEFLYRRDWARASPGEFRAALADYVEWYRDGRLKLFVEPDGTRRYETIMGRRRRLGLAG